MSLKLFPRHLKKKGKLAFT